MPKRDLGTDKLSNTGEHHDAQIQIAEPESRSAPIYAGGIDDEIDWEKVFASLISTSGISMTFSAFLTFLSLQLSIPSVLVT